MNLLLNITVYYLAKKGIFILFVETLFVSFVIGKIQIIWQVPAKKGENFKINKQGVIIIDVDKWVQEGLYSKNTLHPHFFLIR